MARRTSRHSTRLEPRSVDTNSQNRRGYVVDLMTPEERRITRMSADTANEYRFNWNTAVLVSPNDLHTCYCGANKLLGSGNPFPPLAILISKGSVTSVGTCGARQTPIASSPPLRPRSLSESARTPRIPNGPSVGHAITFRSSADDRTLHVSKPTSFPAPSVGTGRVSASPLVTCSRFTMASCGRLKPIAASIENDRSLLPNRIDPTPNCRALHRSSSPRRMRECHRTATSDSLLARHVRNLRAAR